MDIQENNSKVLHDEAVLWQAMQEGLPKNRDYYEIYAVVHVKHGVILARGNEQDWENGNFTHWHSEYRYRGIQDKLTIPVFP